MSRVNLAICTGVAGDGTFSTLMVDQIPDVGLVGAGTQCFPLYWYTENTGYNSDQLFLDLEQQQSGRWTRTDAISDETINFVRSAYPGEAIEKHDFFFYIYGLLHSEEYKERYKSNLVKGLPRIPFVASIDDFRKFEYAGRELAGLHLNYDHLPLNTDVWIESKIPHVQHSMFEVFGGEPKDFRVKKMKYPRSKDGDTGEFITDKTTIVYNDNFTVHGIPEEVHGYHVNGKSAVDWIVDQQQVRTDRRSGIVNDPNDWAIETMGNPRYPLELLLRVITVSLRTQEIVRSLPKLRIREEFYGMRTTTAPVDLDQGMRAHG